MVSGGGHRGSGGGSAVILQWPEWRNWQTRATQNRVPKRSVGSIPSSGTTTSYLLSRGPTITVCILLQNQDKNLANKPVLRTQNPVTARSWGFDSPLRHQPSLTRDQTCVSYGGQANLRSRVARHLSWVAAAWFSASYPASCIVLNLICGTSFPFFSIRR